MEKQIFINENNSMRLIYLLFAVGLAGHIAPVTRNLFVSITPYTLLFMGVLVLYFPLKNGNISLLVWAAATFLFTFLIEAVGVKTGSVFGSYTYGDSLGIKLFGVPLVIGFNWVLVISGSIAISKSISSNFWLTAFYAALFAVLLDFFLEPAAVTLGYWQWEGGHIPFNNYAAWFVIAFSASVIASKVNLKFNAHILGKYFIAQLVYFILLSILI